MNELEKALISLQRQINELRAWKDRLNSREQQRFVPLATPLTSTSYDGDDSIAVGTVTIDTSAVFGAPAGIKAALLRVQAAWGAADGNSSLNVRPVGSSICGIIRAHDLMLQDMTVICPCDVNGDFDVVATNATAFVVTIQIWGYWI